MSLSFVRSVTVRFHPFNAHNGSARQFLAQVCSPAYEKKFSSCETKWEVDYETNIDPSIEFVFENNETKVIKTKGLSVGDLFLEVTNVIDLMEQHSAQTMPENDEENPYLAMAKQQEEKLEAKRKKMLAMEAKTLKK